MTREASDREREETEARALASWAIAGGLGGLDRARAIARVEEFLGRRLSVDAAARIDARVAGIRRGLTPSPSFLSPWSLLVRLEMALQARWTSSPQAVRDARLEMERGEK